jgi:ribonuclease VapC
VIVDSSALVAILRNEDEAPAFSSLLEASRTSVSAASLLETCLVAGPERYAAVDELVSAAMLRVVPFDDRQVREARTAHARFGRGTGHPAQLNYGDCMSYALAKVTGEPLLFKGDDFTHTDVEAAWTP